jgi:uracil-DNA glycosylase
MALRHSGKDNPGPPENSSACGGDSMPSNDSEFQGIVEDVRRHLRWQEEVGGQVLLAGRTGETPSSAPLGLPTQNRSSSIPPSAAGKVGPLGDRPHVSQGVMASPHLPEAAARPSAVPPPPQTGVLTPVTPSATLDEIRRDLGDCSRCKLCKGRTQIVFGTGNPKAELVFVGEGPGADEDAQGVPFVGKAGQLLTKMIEAMGFSRDDVYICNVVKCRPPNNRNPEPDEIAACEPFLIAQLHSIQPKVIVALGKFAAQTLLRDSTPITRLRGQWREYAGIPLMPTFHPAYLLRSPQEKKKAWLDLQQVMKVFGKSARKGETA